MSENEFLDAVSGIDADIVERFVAMDEDLHIAKKNKRNTLVKWTSVIAACLALTVGIGFFAPTLMTLFKGDIPPVNTDDDIPSANTGNELPVDIDEIIWGKSSLSGNVSSEAAGVIVNGFLMDWSLWEAMSDAEDDEYIAVIISDKNGIPYTFKYNGRTYAELIAEREEIYKLSRALQMFLKEGKKLKYGELLYTTGTPDGEKWSKNYYDQRVAHYGEDFIAEYIANGELQTQKIAAAIRDCKRNTYKNTDEISALSSAYYSSDGVIAANAVGDIFKQAGAHIVVKKNKVLWFAQKSDIESINVENKEQYSLTLAIRSLYEGADPSDTQTDLNVVHLDDTVTGFDLDKIIIYGISKKIETESELRAILAEMARNNDYIEVYSKTYSSAQMLCREYMQQVNEVTVDMEYIKNLSLRDDVIMVEISAHNGYVAVPE